MFFSIVVGFVLVGVLAFGFTGSAAILSDTAESTVHMVAILFAAYSLRLTHKPTDRSHLYGHAKIGFFSAGVKGCLILVAAQICSSRGEMRSQRPANRCPTAGFWLTDS
jgi:divalent metal cation (Fe/Co/Zn/Cd) transporter